MPNQFPKLNIARGCMTKFSLTRMQKLRKYLYDAISSDAIKLIQDASLPSFSGNQEEIFDIVSPEARKLEIFKKNSKIFTEGEYITHFYMLKNGIAPPIFTNNF